MRASRIATAEANDLFDMANLSPTLTGLPMIVWISERGRARHDARVKVSLVHGCRAHPERTASVSVRPTGEVVARPELDRQDMELVRQWIEMNREAIIAYWNGDLLTDEVIARLKPVASSQLSMSEWRQPQRHAQIRRVASWKCMTGQCPARSCS